MIQPYFAPETTLLFDQLESHILAERGRTYHLWGDWNCAIADYHRAVIAIDADDMKTQHSTSSLRLQVETWLDELIGLLN